MSVGSIVILQPEYVCKSHGIFPVRVERPRKEIPKKASCPKCNKKCPPRPERKMEGDISHLVVKRDWNEKANIARANPAEQMKSQLDSVKKAEEAREKHGDPRANFLEGE